MRREYKIGIIGFGIAGGALAVFLARAGHLVTVFERAPVVGPVGTGLLLQPSGQLVLQQLGLLAPIIAQSEPIHELIAAHRSGAKLVHLHYKHAAAKCCAYGVHRGALFGALHAAAILEPNVEIRLGADIVARTVENDQTQTVDSAGERHGSFDFLIVADGSRSGLRESIDPNPHQHEYQFGALWAIGRCTQIHNHLRQIVDGTRHLLGLLPTGGDRCTLFWSLRHTEIDDLRARGFDKWREQVVGLSALADEVLADVGGFENVIFSRYRHSIASRQFDEHAVCVGDAAHAMSPHLGQGANLALLDAECFASAVNATDNFADACRLYTVARRNHVLYYARLSRYLTPFFQSDGWLLGMGRDIALPLMSRFPPTRRIMALSMAGVKCGLLLGSTMSVETLPKIGAPEINKQISA